MKLSVAISTWNRSNSLRRTLESIADASVPPGLVWEIIVINNNSTDDTDRVIDSFADRLPIRRLFEPIQGVARAKNTGAAAARGEFIIWTDDDVIVSRSWLTAYCQAFERWPNAVLFGGPIRPAFDQPMPRWLEQGWQSVESAFAANDLGADPVALSATERRIPYGANFAIRRVEQLKHHYHPTLGPGTAYYAEETTMIIELLKVGGEGWWVPAAAVDHAIPQTRMTIEYIWSYYKKIGRTQYYIDHYIDRRATARPERRLLGRPRWLWRRVAEAEFKFWVSRTFQSPEHWLVALRVRGESWGAFEESAGARGSGPT